MKRVFFPLLLTTPQVEFPCVSFQNMTTSQSFKQCVSNIPEFAYCKSCMLSSRCTYSLVQKEPATLVFYYINQEIEMALPSKVKVVC